jgi:hypothetical protein
MDYPRKGKERKEGKEGSRIMDNINERKRRKRKFVCQKESC